MGYLYRDRVDGAHALIAELQGYRDRRDVVVLALPRGGVPVAFEVARALSAPLDLMLVRKLGLPGQRELAMGAIASGGVRVLNAEVAALVSERDLEEVEAREAAELERRLRTYRGDRPEVELKARSVILVDDGLATGATMRAGVLATRAREPKEVVVAVPVAPGDTVAMLRGVADAVVCPWTPEPFLAIGRWYENFTQVSDDEVRGLLASAWSSAQSRGPSKGKASERQL